METTMPDNSINFLKENVDFTSDNTFSTYISSQGVNLHKYYLKNGEVVYERIQYIRGEKIFIDIENEKGAKIFPTNI